MNTASIWQFIDIDLILDVLRDFLTPNPGCWYQWVILSVVISSIIGCLCCRERKKDRYVNTECMNIQSKKYLQLVKLSVDTANEIVRCFTTVRLLKKHGGSFTAFLNNSMHYLYHQWPGGLSCCECPPIGCNIPKSKSMANWIFRKLYVEANTPVRGHLKMKERKIVEHCLHVFIPTPGISIEDIDITVLAFLLRQCASLTSQECDALDKIVEKRNILCHVNKTDHFTSSELDNIWKILENAFLELVQPAYKNIVKEQIRLMKKVDFGCDEIHELFNKCKDIKTSVDKIEDKICKNGAVSNSVKDLQKSIREESKDIKSKIHQQADIIEDFKKHISKNMETTLAMYFGKLECQMNSLESIVRICAASKVQTNENDKEEDTSDTPFDVLCKIPSGQVDDAKVVRRLQKNLNQKNKDVFTITSAQSNCVILQLSASKNILKDTHSLYSAVNELFQTIVVAGNLDTTVPGVIEINLIFLTPLSDTEIDVIDWCISNITLPDTNPSEESDESLSSDEEAENGRQTIGGWNQRFVDVGVQVDLLSVPYVTKITLDNKELKRELSEKKKAIKDLKGELKKFQRKRHRREKRKKSSKSASAELVYTSTSTVLDEFGTDKYTRFQPKRSKSVPFKLKASLSFTTSESESQFMHMTGSPVFTTSESDSHRIFPVLRATSEQERSIRFTTQYDTDSDDPIMDYL